MRAVGRATVAATELSRWTEPWNGLVRERALEDGVFVADEGPFREYRREVTVQPADDGHHQVTSTVRFRLAIPFFGWLLAPLVRAQLRRAGAPLPWWGPVQRIDARSASVLGSLCAASVVAGYLGTSVAQTITYAAENFGHEGKTPQANALAVVRLAVFIALALVALADRRGRRRLLLASAAAGCVLAVTTALAPSLAWYTASQTLVRGCSTALAVLIAVVAAEEMPANARAFGASVLGMSAALGAGMCVMALPLADLDPDGWRLLFVIPLLGLPLLRRIARQLPESRRFEVGQPSARIAGHGSRLTLLAASTFLLGLFTAPASQLQNEFLRDERAYSAAAISLFTVVTNTPAGIGVLIGGRLADRHGRRRVAALGLIGGIGGTVAVFLTHGASMWLWSLGASIIGGATLPALGVYGPELFPTRLRGRANGLIVMASTAGAVTGLLLAGVLSDALGGLGAALALLSIGPAVLVVLVLTRYPETAHLELEELNPEDAPPPAS
jgi:MFS family permease